MAWSEIHGRPVSLKLPQVGADLDSARRSLTREAQRLGATAHPAFQRLLGADLDAPEPFLVLEYVEGHTLQTILDEEGPVKERDALNIASELLAALGFLHRTGYAHLDVKPGNVILRDGRVVVLDLGLVLPLGTPIPAGSPRGTDGYIAPEQWDCAPASAAMDVFSVGCLTYELILGEAPFPREGRPAGTPSFPPRARFRRRPHCSPAVERTIRALLAVDPRERPPVAAHALALLGSIRPAADRLWPDYVDDLLRTPTAVCPIWAEPPFIRGEARAAA
jgi:serine/threonine protein kinase